MSYRQFSLRTFLGFFLSFCVLVGLIATSEFHNIPGVVIAGIVGRTIAIIIVGVIVRVANGKVEEGLASATFGVLFADVVWLSLLRILGESIDSKDVAYNPLLLITLLTCPAACVTSRARAIAIAASISVLFPAFVATWQIIRLPTGPGVGGTGLAAIMIAIVAGVATITGFVGMVLTRGVLEFLKARGKKAHRGESQ